MNNVFKRRIDELGRIVIPKQIRESFKICNFDELNIFIRDNYIVIKKNIAILQFKEKFDVFLKFINKASKFSLVITDKNNIISSNFEIDINDIKNIEYNNIVIFRDKFLLKSNIIIDSNYIGDLYFIHDCIFDKENDEVKQIKNIILNFIK